MADPRATGAAAEGAPPVEPGAVGLVAIGRNEGERLRACLASARGAAQRLVYGWPSRHEDPTGAQSQGRFVRAFPLDFLIGIADLFEERPRKVSGEAWVQHLLRYRTGHFVGGSRGQRVL